EVGDKVILNPDAKTSSATYYLKSLQAVYVVAQPGR
ncbi:MAG: hypothetical protein ACI8W8_004513, partial [Rhodothermales bacterium]